MKRKGITMTLTAAGFLCLLGVWLGLKNYNEKAEIKEAEQAEGETVWDVEPENVTKLSFSIGEVEYTFARDGKNWTLKGDDTFPVAVDVLEETLSEMLPVKSLRTLTEVEDVSEYGMENPQNVISIETQSGEQTTLTIGDTNESTGNDYVMMGEDTSTVYTVSSALRTAVAEDLYSYAVSEQLPVETKEDVVSVTVENGDSKYRVYQEEGAWKLEVSGEIQDADSDAVLELCSTVAGLYYSDYIEHNCQDPSTYGLEEPAAVITVLYNGDGTEQKLVIRVGDEDSVGNYYTQLEGSTQIHTISCLSIDQFLECRPKDLAAAETENETEMEAALENGEETEAASESGEK